VTRCVEPVAAFEDEVLADFRAPPVRCVEGVVLLLRELERHDPEPAERCGLLDDRHELYAIPVPGCGAYRLLVSLDTAGNRPWPCTLHGLRPAARNTCDTARTCATRHFGLIAPTWEG